MVLLFRITLDYCIPSCKKMSKRLCDRDGVPVVADVVHSGSPGHIVVTEEAKAQNMMGDLLDARYCPTVLSSMIRLGSITDLDRILYGAEGADVDVQR